METSDRKKLIDLTQKAIQNLKEVEEHAKASREILEKDLMTLLGQTKLKVG